jgi:hypothetical protein
MQTFRIKIDRHVYDVEGEYPDDALMNLLHNPRARNPVLEKGSFCMASHIEIDLLPPPRREPI